MRRKRKKKPKKLGLHQHWVKAFSNIHPRSLTNWKIRRVKPTQAPHGIATGWVLHWIDSPQCSVSLYTKGDTAYLTDLWAKYKRQGYGTKLVQAALERARSLHLKKVTLWVRNTTEAKAFWEKQLGHGGWWGVIKLGTWRVIKL